jgi:hypothetical protein
MRSQMNLSGKIEEEEKEIPAAGKKGSTSKPIKDKKLKKAAKTAKGGSALKVSDKKAGGGGTRAGKYEVRVKNVDSSQDEDNENPKKGKEKDWSSEEDEEAEEKKKIKNLKEIAKYEIKSQTP